MNNALYLQTMELYVKKYGYSYPSFKAESSNITPFGQSTLLQRTIKFYQTLKTMLFTEHLMIISPYTIQSLLYVKMEKEYLQKKYLEGR